MPSVAHHYSCIAEKGDAALRSEEVRMKREPPNGDRRMNDMVRTRIEPGLL